jgi:hypothetical protein
MNQREHSTFNIQHSTPKWEQLTARVPLKVERWTLNVECFLHCGGFQ